MKYHLFLDDERNLSDVTWVTLPSKINFNWIVARNYDEFVKTVLSFGIPEFVTFDHDLADIIYAPEKTGYDCCKWLVEFCEERQVKFPEFEVHSMNPVGAERIHSYIESAKKHLNI